MSEPTVTPAIDGDALLAQADAIHDDDAARALEMLRRLDVASLPPGRLARLSFLLDHVLGEKFGLWREALDRQRAVVRHAGDHRWFAERETRKKALAAHYGR